MRLAVAVEADGLEEEDRGGERPPPAAEWEVRVERAHSCLELLGGVCVTREERVDSSQLLICVFAQDICKRDERLVAEEGS